MMAEIVEQYLLGTMDVLTWLEGNLIQFEEVMFNLGERGYYL